MATYYVRTDGNNANAGTGPASNQAWETIAKAITSAVAPGDTIYIAPGIYRESALTPTFTNPSNNSQRISYIGDTSASQFTGVSSGPVIITTYATNTSGTTAQLMSWSKDYTSFTNLCFIGYPTTSSPTFGQLMYITGIYPIFIKCLVQQPSTSTQNSGILYIATYNARGIDIRKSVILNCNLTIQGSGTAAGQWDSQSRVEDCIIQANNSHFNMQAVRIYSDPVSTLGGVTINNNYLSGYGGVGVVNTGSSTYPAIVQNNYIEASNVALSAGATNQMTQTYNVLFGSITRTNVSSSATSYENAFAFKNGDISRIQGWADYTFTGPITNNSLQVNTGINTLSPATDIYGVTWNTPSTPTIGAAEYYNYSPVGSYMPTDRNASAITIAPGSTSQSIELYLGVTGLTASTSGLSAYYNRTRTASVSIPLVARTIAQAWTAGGFAEVDATNMPGVYRLDLPDAALASGADDVTVVVRGASGTNGAVMAIKLSSGGLTSAQTASAVWGASPAGYGDATTFGGVVNQTDSVVNGIDTRVQDVPSQVWDEMRSTHTMAGSFGEYVNTNINTGAIADAVWDEPRSGHTTAGTFGQYVNAELVTPVSQASLVRMGPFQVIADGVTTPMPLDIQKGAQHGVDIQCVDNNLQGVDITAATVTAKVYDSGGALVDTYSCTATYAADGRATFTIDTTVTNTPGTYTATITRTTGASDTQVFGPLRIYVRDI